MKQVRTAPGCRRPRAWSVACTLTVFASTLGTTHVQCALCAAISRRRRRWTRVTLHHRRLLPTHMQRALCGGIARRRRRYTRGPYRSCVERRDCSGARLPTGTARRRHADRLCTVACRYTHASRPVRRSPDALRPGPYRIQLVTGWWWWI